MYTCPKCGEHNITVYRTIRVIEYWNEDDVETEEDLSYERDPDQDAAFECNECGYESPDSDEWEWS